MKTIHAVFEKGVFRPTEQVELPERCEVEFEPRVLGAEKIEEDWFAFLQRARADLEAAGHKFRTKEEIDAEIDDLRSDPETSQR